MRAICCAILALVFMKAWFTLSKERAAAEQRLAGYAGILSFVAIIASICLCIAGL